LIRASTSLFQALEGVDGRDMCGWPPARKDFFTCLH
jgi:hypothetical protein